MPRENAPAMINGRINVNPMELIRAIPVWYFRMKKKRKFMPGKIRIFQSMNIINVNH
jgi:hypothetical protein